MPTKKDDVYGDHISHKFNDELMELKTEFLKMGGMVEAQVDNAILALVDGDGHLADEIRSNDKKVDRMEVEIDEEATLIIARRQPTARDLRLVISVIKMVADLERVGDEAKKIAVIGAGLIGCEFTNDLLNGGFEVEAVDPMGWCLPTLLPEPAGRAVQAALEAKGATFHFGPLATEVNKTGDGYAVTLNNGDTISADAVLSAVGGRPRTGLAAAAGLEVGRGIKTDRFLKTSAEGIYALGDCAEVAGHVLVYVAPLRAAGRA